MSKKDEVKKPSGKVKKTVLNVLLVILIVLLIVAAVVGIKFRSHIKAAIIWLTTSDEDIQKNIDKAKEQQTEVLANSGFNASKELDEALTSGLITAEEHTQILLGKLTLEEILQNTPETDDTADEIQNSDETGQDVTGQEDANQNETDEENSDEPDEAQNEDVGKENQDEPDSEKTEKPVKEEKDGQNKTDTKNNSSGKKEDASAPAKPDSSKNEASKSDTSAVTTPKPSTGQNTDSAEVDKRIAEIVTRMYVLKSEYTGAIDGIVASMKAEYVLLPVEQRNRSAKQSIAARYMAQINSMEIQCDAQVNSIVAELRTLLKNNGRDTALADAIMSTYASEKENTKAYYLSTYGD